jgi:hypothetical protein
MVATVHIYEMTGGTDGNPDYNQVDTGLGTVRLFSDDVATNESTLQTTNPIVIPSSGFNYSFWKHVCLGLSGTYTNITNIRHYGTGSNPAWNFGTGGQLRRGNRDSGDQGCPQASYDVASGTAGTTGDELGANHSYYSAQTTKTKAIGSGSDTSASPMVVDNTTTYTGTIYTKAVVLQAKVDTAANGAIQGTQTAYTLTWAYDES